MIALLNIGRFLMLAWIVYGLVLIFSPGLLHQAPDQKGGMMQVGAAFALGYLLDRAISAVHRRRAARSEAPQTEYTGKEI